MGTLLKRLAILAALWLGVSVAGVVYINTRSQEQFESDLRSVLEPTLGALDETLQSALTIGSAGFEPLPPDDAMRAEAQATLAEVEAIYDELIAVRETIQAAQTDQWEKRWAGDAVTIAKMDKERTVEAIQRARREVDNPPSGPISQLMTPSAVSNRLDTARRNAGLHKMFVEDELAKAREKLQSINGAPPQ